MKTRPLTPTEMAEEANLNADTIIRRLLKSPKQEVQQLGLKLEACLANESSSCGSAACYVCRGQASQSFQQSVVQALRHHQSVDYWTIIPSDGKVAFGQLDGFDVKAFIRRHMAKLKRTLPNGLVVIGAADVSLNTFENENRHWQYHFHLFFLSAIGKDTEKVLRRRYIDPSGSILRSVTRARVQSQDFQSTASYTFKSDFKRRSSFIAIPETGRKPYKTSSGQTLKADEDIELTIALKKYMVSDLLFLIGMKRVRSSSPANIRLMRIKRK